MSSSGYGICGHKNSYGTNVLCGNWVEDKMGGEMEALTRTPRFDAVSEAQHHFAHPDKRTPSVGVAQTEDAMASKPSMRGLENSLLLGHCEHGNVHNPSSEGRFNTTHKLSFTTPSPSSSASGDHAPRKIGLAQRRQMDAERRELDPHFTTSYKVACAQPFRPQATLEAKPVTARFSSNRAFTKAFVQAQSFGNIRSDRLALEY